MRCDQALFARRSLSESQILCGMTVVVPRELPPKWTPTAAAGDVVLVTAASLRKLRVLAVLQDVST